MKATISVIIPAGSMGMPNTRFRASAAPTNSARSVAIATDSACNLERPAHTAGR
jgi:hypothetical protein